MTAKRKPVVTGRLVGRIATAMGFAIVVVMLLLWLAGVFSRKIDHRLEAGAPRAEAGGRPVGDTPLAEARIIQRPRMESAVGTIRAVHEVGVAAKLLAKVTEVNVRAGQVVRKGELLAKLYDEDLRSALKQAAAAVAAAQAAVDHAQTEFDRIQRLYEQHNAAKTEFDAADTTLKDAKAKLDGAQQARDQAKTILDYATIVSPIEGTVIEKQIEVGDTAEPGKVLLTLYDPTRMQLVASVRESLTQRLKVGEPIGVHVDALGKTCEGRISEIVPEAQSASRTFAVKVTGPCPPGIYSGMFGRLLIPLDMESVLVIPKAAVRRIGQLDVVAVAEPAAVAGAPSSAASLPASSLVLRRRVVQLGREFDDDVEVLSGLRAGEKVALEPANAVTTRPAAQLTTP